MSNAISLKGLGVALPTPFMQDGAIDMDSFVRVVRHVVSGGADFLVVLGSTGEAATIDDGERASLIRAAVANSGGRIVVAGTGHNSTAKAARYSAEARECGADGILVVTPYYNKPQVSGLVLHYRAVAEAAGGLPALVYNVPGRTGYNLLPRDLERLWEIPGIAGVKESSGNLSQIGEIARTLPEGKVLLAGDDALALPAIALGAEGLISVAGNAYPARMKALVEYALSGNRGEAGRVHAAMLPFMDALFLESNPAPLKTALFLMGLCGYCTRLPLVPASETTRARLAELIASFQARDARGVA